MIELVIVIADVAANPIEPNLVSPSAVVIKLVAAGVPVPLDVGRVVLLKAWAPVCVSASTIATVPALSGNAIARSAVGLWESVVVDAPL